MLPYLILGILKYGAMSGYDLNKAFAASVNHFWDTEQSLIYRALYKLHEQGLVVVDVVAQESAPSKKLYHLTDAGWAELRRWLETPMPMPSLHEGWLGQLFFASELSSDQIRRLLETRIVENRALLDHYQNDVPALAAEYAERFGAYDDAAYWLVTLDYGIAKARFDIEWAERALKQLTDSTNPNE